MRTILEEGELRFGVAGMAAWSPGCESPADWLNWAGRPGGHVVPSAASPQLPMMLRRRVTGIGQKLLSVAMSLPHVDDARFILASRHGEFSRVTGILETLADREEVSPAEFSMAVHHALAGMLSIATGNRLGHTAVAAGPDSFAYGLLEAAACLHDRPDEPVIFLYFDEPLPASYRPFADTPEHALAFAALLVAPGRGQGDVILSQSPGDGGSGCGATEFLRFWFSGAGQGLCSGHRVTSRWRRA